MDLKGPFYGASSSYLTFEFHGLRLNLTFADEAAIMMRFEKTLEKEDMK